MVAGRFHRCCGFKRGACVPKGASLYDEANGISKLSLSWLRPVIHDSLKDPSFGIKNLHGVERKAESRALYSSLRHRRDVDMDRGLSLFRTFFGFIPRSYWLNTLPWMCYLLAVYSQSILLGAYLSHFESLRADSPYDRDWWGWVMVVLYAVLGLGMAVCSQVNFTWSIHVGVRARVAMTTLLYNKLLKLRESAKGVLSSGNLVNLMFTDTSRISIFVQYITVMIFVPVEVVVAVGLIARKLGILVLLPFGLLVVLFGFSMLMGKIMMRARVKIMNIADGRVRKTAEVLGGIRVIKLFGNEDVFYKRIATTRSYEFRYLKTYSLSQQSMTALVDIIIPIICISTYALMRSTGMAITPSLVYEVTSLLNTLRNPFIFLPMSIITIQDFMVSVRRISALLSLPEKVPGDNDFRDSSGRQFADWEQQILTGAGGRGKEPGLDEGGCGAPVVDDVAISIARPSTFSWASAEDLEVPAIIDEDNYRNTAEAKKTLERELELAKELCSTRGLKMEAAWTTFAAIVPETLMVDTGGHRKGGPATPGEASAFTRWLSMGMPANEAPRPARKLALYPVLINMKLEVRRGETVGVCGRVGCGKTSFLNALLGELRVCHRRDEFAPPEELDVELVRGEELGIVDPEEGQPALRVRGRIAYCAQSAWIMNASVRDNITFGLPLDRSWYDEVVDACCLRSDFAQFVAGDQTEIGEKGATLSGGQKHRIALARAVYSNADIYLLDDPLSAVDAHVGKRLFEDVVLGLLRDKTVILATHQLQFLPRCDRSVCISEHRIVHDGPFNEQLLQNALGDDYKKAIAQYTALLETPAPALASGPTPLLGQSTLQSPEETDSVSAEVEQRTNMDLEVVEDQHGAEERDRLEKDRGRLVEDEAKGVGGLKMKKVGQYFRSAGSIAYIILILICIVAELGLVIAADYMQAEWTSFSGTARGERSFLIYAITLVLFIVLFFVSAYSLSLVFLKASRNIHLRVVRSVLNAPMSFFDATPSGRILNRFSKDTDNTDTLVPMYFYRFVVFLVYIIEMVVVVGITNPYVLIAIAAIYVVYGVLLFQFRAAPRELRRMDNITRSPVYSLTTETLNGAATIRAYNSQRTFTGLYFDRLDKNTTAGMMYMLSMRWLSFRYDLVGVIPIIAMTVLGLVMHQNDRIAVMIGLGLTYTFTIPMLTREMASNFIYAESEFSSVERLLEYRDKLPSERPKHIATDPESGAPLMPPGWPTRGDIEFDHVGMRYRPTLPLVLKDVSFTVASGEKIGVVGRTGAGKTSITASLFQLYNCEEGSRVLLDGVDLTRLGIHDVRKSIAIIPQDAFLFSGTLRENLDVANLLINEETSAMGRRFTGASAEKKQRKIDEIVRANGLEGKLISSEAMWDALDKCMLKEAFMARPGGLDFVLSDNGANLSAGERQLVCLAKALLLGCHVIIMDEATAQVDQDSDNNVQRVIRESFKDRTILCIAHRLQTIIDFDRILVMDSGQIAEFDAPGVLLSQPASIFSSLVDETGPESSAFLRSIALGEKTIFDSKLEMVDSASESCEASPSTSSSGDAPAGCGCHTGPVAAAWSPTE